MLIHQYQYFALKASLRGSDEAEIVSYSKSVNTTRSPYKCDKNYCVLDKFEQY